MKVATIINRYEELRNNVKEFVVKKYELHKIQHAHITLLLEYILLDDENNVHTLVRVVEVKSEEIVDVIGVYPCMFPLTELEEFLATGNIVKQSTLEEFEKSPYEEETEDGETAEEEIPLDKTTLGH